MPRPFSNKSNKHRLEKWLILGLGQGIYRSLQHFGVPESKEVLKNTLMRMCQKDIGGNWKRFFMATAGKFEQQNQIVLGYNPKFKVNTCESILI